MMDEKKIFLESKDICKQFNGIAVLKSVDLDIRYGEVHALMGENGAGKSTIIKIITGVYSKDSGEIYIDGEQVEINNRQDARKLGISVIYQELSLVPALTVEENISLGQETCNYGICNIKKMKMNCRELIDRYDFDLRTDSVVESLSMAQRQLVEILKALSMNAKLIIMDEPTSALSTEESEKLFCTIDNLRSKGTAILYISHRLEEVYRIADRLTVMRDGEKVGVLQKDEITPQAVIPMMLGKDLKVVYKNKESGVKPSENVLEVIDLFYKGILRGVNFKAYGGEILGIGGLVGSGRSELIECIYGTVRPRSGTILYNGKPVSRSVAKNIRHGLVLVPEDRRLEGFIPNLSIERNLALINYDILAPKGLVSRIKEIKWAENAIKSYDIRPPLKELFVGNLSGGNQQKVVVARCLARKPEVLILDEPTVGIDVGVKGEIYQMIRDLANSGAIVIMVSSDLAELRGISDRILVMYDGRFFEEFTEVDNDHASQHSILLAASGIHSEEGIVL